MNTFDAVGLGHVIAAAMVAAFCGSVAAQTCSGGPDGGMDATGNQCNDVVQAGVEIDPDSPYEHLKPVSSAPTPDASIGASARASDDSPAQPLDKAAFQRVRGETDAVSASPRDY